MRFVAALCLTLVAACGAAPPPASLRAGVAASEPPLQHPVDRYSTEAQGPGMVSPDGVGDALREGLSRFAEQPATPIQPDARLSELALWTVQTREADLGAPGYTWIAHQCRRLGLVEPVPAVMLVGANTERQATEALLEAARASLADGRRSHYGAAIQPRFGGYVAALVVSSRWLSLKPVPQRVASGGSVDLSGKLSSGYHTPLLAVTDPSGAVTRRPLGKQRTIQTRVELAAAGVHQVELLAEGPAGLTVVANFPVGVDTSPHGAPPRATAIAAEGGSDTVRSRLFELVNETRAMQGLAPLKLDEALSSVARGHSTDMAEAGFVGHLSPTTGNAPDRVRTAGLRTQVVLENIGRGYSAEEIHAGLMASPGHRGNILNPDVHDLGIGVVSEPEHGRTAFLATEVFAHLARVIDVGSAPAQLLARVNRERKRAGLRPLKVAKAMRQAAQRTARRFFDEHSLDQSTLLGQAVTPQLPTPRAAVQVGGVMEVVSHLHQAGLHERLADPALRWVGIGVQQGSRADTGEHAIAVVWLLAFTAR